MRILILGGTAFLSAEIARQAVAAGHDVTCLARGSAAEPPAGARWVKADRSLGAECYADAAGDWDAVIDVARNPVPAAEALAALAGRTGHWTFVSSCSVYADHATPNDDEYAALLQPLAPGAESTPENYGESKSAIENETLSATGGNAHLCRAGLIGGPGDRTDRYGYWPARFARDNRAAVVPDIAAHATQVIDVRDLVLWILTAAERSVTGPLNAVGDPVQFGDYLDEARTAAGYTGEVLAAGEDWLVARGVDYWSGPDSLPLWLPPGHDGFCTRSNDAAKAAGMVTRPWQQTLADTLADERRQGLARRRKAGLTPATEARLAEELLLGR
ncbi:NAD-dependent epimerase/dehydratase family protein [Pseudarthrobacter sulfonivorans]|uniref:NAD-dependent epimerase/dehydratase family protein n=1 Tax=Pseudarthrobacter sulfonivorans TaxID=121292 RepID=UPI002102BEF1|nr:NAD-dependent epimerase/dehydratase family protein [Pseudarthrobacter sulfonivorans]